MIEHTEIRRKLSDFLDDAVSDAERATIVSHLAECAQCRKALAELQKTITLLKTLPEVEPPPWLTAKIMAQVRDEAPRTSLWRRLFLPLQVKLPVEAFAVLFICVMGYYLARNNPQLASPTAPLPASEERGGPAEAPAAPAPVAPTAPPVPAPPAPLSAPKPAAPASAPAAPPAPSAPAAQAAPAAGYAPAPPGHLKSSSPAPRQPSAEPKPAPQSAAPWPSASAPPSPSPAPVSEAPASPAPPVHAQRPQGRTYDLPLSQSPLSLMGTPAPETAASSQERLPQMAKAKKAAEQLRVKEHYEQASAEASRRKVAAEQSRQATSTPAAAHRPVPARADGGGADVEAIPLSSPLDESRQAGTVPTVTRLEIPLKVIDPVAAVDAVERAVSRCGGTIVKRAYDDWRHCLVVRMEPAKLSSLSRQLAKIGTVEKRPQSTGEKEAMVEVAISW